MSVEKKNNPFEKAYIYYLYDRKQNRIYVGSSYTSFKKRLYDHRYDLKAYLGQATNKIPRSYRTSFDIILILLLNLKSYLQKGQDSNGS